MHWTQFGKLFLAAIDLSSRSHLFGFPVDYSLTAIMLNHILFGVLLRDAPSASESGAFLLLSVVFVGGPPTLVSAAVVMSMLGKLKRRIKAKVMKK